MSIKQIMRTSMPLSMSDNRKQRIWDGIMQLRKENMKQRIDRRMKGVFAFSIFALIIVAAVVIPMTILQSNKRDDLDETVHAPLKGNEQEQSSDTMAGANKDTVVYLKNVTLSEGIILKVPETMRVMKQIKIDISSEEMAEIEKNAWEHGWQNVSMTGSNGSYSVLSVDVKGDTMTEPVLGGAETGSVSKEHHQVAEMFMQESGLAALLEQKGMSLAKEELTYATLFWSDIDGYQGNGYVRLGIEREKIVADCKIVALRYEELFEAAIIPIEQAIGNAFYIVTEGVPPKAEEGFTVLDVSLKYVRGIPMYEILLEQEDTGLTLTAFALAIGESDIEKNKSVKKEFEEFLELGL